MVGSNLFKFFQYYKTIFIAYLEAFYLREIMAITLGQLLAIEAQFSNTRESYSKQQMILFKFSLDLNRWLWEKAL